MGITDFTPGIDEEDARQLQDISPWESGGIASGHHLQSAQENTRGSHDGKRTPAQAVFPEEGLVRVADNGKCNRERLSELLRLLRGALAYEEDLHSCRVKLRARAVQLHRLVAAEGSAEVPEEDEEDRFLFPERAESTGCPV